MFEVPTLGQLIVTIFAILLAYYAYTTDKEESKKKKQYKQEEKEQIDNIVYLTTTRVKFQRHLSTILARVASYKLHSVIITDTKEVPQSVLVPYSEYKTLQEFYEQAKELERSKLLD